MSEREARRYRVQGHVFRKVHEFFLDLRQSSNRVHLDWGVVGDRWVPTTIFTGLLYSFCWALAGRGSAVTVAQPANAVVVPLSDKKCLRFMWMIPSLFKQDGVRWTWLVSTNDTTVYDSFDKLIDSHWGEVGDISID